MALMAINTRKHAIPIKRPSDQEMLDFYANKLTPEANERVFAYLNSNPAEYTAWVECRKKPALTSKITNIFSNTLKSIPLINKRHQLDTSNSVSTNIFISRGFRYAFSVTAICVVILLIYFPVETDISKEINQNYAAFILSTHELNSTDLTLPWETPDNTFGFAPVENNAAPNQAFAAGLIIGKTHITSQQPLPEIKQITIEKLKPEAKAWPEYTHLGLLNMLLWATVQKQEPMPITFWDSQINIINSLKNKFKSKKINQEFVLKHLNTLTILISELKKESSNPARLYANLNKELSIARQRLALKSETQ